MSLIEADLWHKRLSHINQKRLEALSKQDILPQEINNKLSFCKHCALGKARKQSFTKAQHNKASPRHNTQIKEFGALWKKWNVQKTQQYNNEKSKMPTQDGPNDCLSKHLFIRARFRSWDLWVMGPPRFRCATLIG